MIPVPWPDLPWTFVDAAKAKAGAFTPSRAAERAYERTLRSLAGRVSQILTSHRPQDAEDILRAYAESITPWARQSAANMLDGVARGNLEQFSRIASRMGLDMRAFLGGDPIGLAVAARIEENTRLIRTIPLEAAQRAGELAHEALITGMRAEDMARELAGIGSVTMSRARCIALTETGKASTALTRARAGAVGSEGYIWRSVRDGSTRPSHRAQEGKYVLWDKPPTLDGMTGHAGEYPYCRCYPEPVIPKGDGNRKTFAVSLPTQAQEKAGGTQRLLTQWEKSAGAEVVRHVPGAPLYNAERAFVPTGKISGYSLNPEHSSGKHKARKFKAALGFTPRHVRELEEKLLAGLPAVKADRDGFTPQGAEKFVALVPITGPNGKTIEVRSVWQYVRKGMASSTRPQLITVYIDD